MGGYPICRSNRRTNRTSPTSFTSFLEVERKLTQYEFLQYATDALGRKYALYILWGFLVASIFAETFASHWSHWLVAKLFSGIGVGMLQATMPVYLSEVAPTQLRGFFINAYSL